MKRILREDEGELSPNMVGSSLKVSVLKDRCMLEEKLKYHVTGMFFYLYNIYINKIKIKRFLIQNRKRKNNVSQMIPSLYNISNSLFIVSMLIDYSEICFDNL